MTAEQPDDPVIRTPDQRLRVFVSSTLGELAQERQSVSGAITTLRLIPVMFELGARPYPPRDLYRAYVAQSDVFIGLYWQRYGWVGPGMEISGLEDELELARGLPRLLYVKAPAPDRDARLTDLLDGIEAEAFESYRSFRTPRELARLVRDDLATLLSERFAATRRDAVSTPRSVRSPGSRLPVSTTSLLGREQDIDAVAGLVRGPDARLVTLTGPGGVGKTRLAVAVAERVRDRFEAGTAFVPLASVTRPEQVVGSIARAVGADLRGAGAPVQALVEQLGEGAWLLILDNVEQVVGAAGDLGELLSRSRGVTLLATSRTVLGLRGEREYPVAPLPLAADLDGMPIDELATSPAVALFVDRARAIRPDFTLTGANARAVVGICRRVEGMPLAIELAAARTRLLEPAAILRRLSASLDALGKGGTDLPERQRTLRATVDWSVGLLDDSERSLLETMAVFVDGWTIEAAADVAELEENGVLELTEALARHSLVQLDRTEFGRPRMLETVREFIAERLAARPDVADVQRRHAHYFAAFAEQADRPLRGIGHNAWLDRLEPEAGNLAVAAGWYMVHERSRLPHLFRVLWLFWELRDHVGEARATVDELLPTAESLDPQSRAELLWTAVANAAEVGDDQAALSASQQLAPLLEQITDPFLRAVSQLAISWTAPIRGDIAGALRRASTSLAELRGQDEPYWTAVTAISAGTLEMAVDRNEDASGHLREAHELGQQYDYVWLVAWSLIQLGTLTQTHGRMDEARALLDEGLAVSLATQSARNITLCLAAYAQLAFAEGDPQRAALLAGATEGLRRRVGLRAWPMLRPPEALLLQRIRAALGTERFDRLYASGSRLNQAAAVNAVRSSDLPPE